MGKNSAINRFITVKPFRLVKKILNYEKKLHKNIKLKLSTFINLESKSRKKRTKDINKLFVQCDSLLIRPQTRVVVNAAVRERVKRVNCLLKMIVKVIKSAF